MGSIGVFDSDGNCLAVYSGAGTILPDPRIVSEVPVTGQHSPNDMRFENDEVVVEVPND